MEHNLTPERRAFVQTPTVRKPSVASATLLAALLGSCGMLSDGAPSQETVLSLLRQEAQELKVEGEKLDPAFGVRANWEIEDVEIQKPSNDGGPPWRGTIRFKITSRVREPDGTTSTEEFVRNFEYVWDTELSDWTVR
jgi:hypothetical protein